MMKRQRSILMTLGLLAALALGQYGCAETGNKTMMGDDMQGVEDTMMKNDTMENDMSGMENTMMKSDTMKDGKSGEMDTMHGDMKSSSGTMMDDTME